MAPSTCIDGIGCHLVQHAFVHEAASDCFVIGLDPGHPQPLQDHTVIRIITITILCRSENALLSQLQWTF